jgi:hypothetical protein
VLVAFLQGENHRYLFAAGDKKPGPYFPGKLKLETRQTTITSCSGQW